MLGREGQYHSLHPTVETASCGVAICVSYLVLFTTTVMGYSQTVAPEALVKKNIQKPCSVFE